MEVYNISKLFGQRLKELRENRGLNQEDVGDWFKMRKSTVSQWENGRLPHAVIITELAQKFNVTTDYLLGRMDKPIKELITEPKKPQDLKRILEQHEIMFDGVPIDDDAKEDILHIVEFELYKRAKAMNKRKPKEGEQK